jgi:hypothetical protein
VENILKFLKNRFGQMWWSYEECFLADEKRFKLLLNFTKLCLEEKRSEK